ncbi:MAG: TetR/AcrR family transcriptional regulator [Bacteroidetes bacterium]|nr:MAG: TetR/AcrR family transcriptional regulator [Bacteroidota bacterium]
MGRKSKAAVRKQEILSHFYDVIIDEGFEGASIAKIAKRMDVNPSLLIHYFSTKDAMVLGLIEYIVSTYSSHILPDFSSVTDPAERWDDVLDVVSRIQWDLIMNNTVFYSCYTLALRNPDIRKQFVGLFRTVTQKLEMEIRHAQEAGVIDVEDPARAAELIISLVEGANFYQHVRPGGVGNRDSRQELLKDTIMAVCRRPVV